MHLSCLRALPPTSRPTALNFRSTPLSASLRATGQGSPAQDSSPSEMSTSTRRPLSPRSSTGLYSEYAMGVSPTALKESTARYIFLLSRGPTGSTSSVSRHALGLVSLGSAISDQYT